MDQRSKHLLLCIWGIITVLLIGIIICYLEKERQYLDTSWVDTFCYEKCETWVGEVVSCECPEVECPICFDCLCPTYEEDTYTPCSTPPCPLIRCPEVVCPDCSPQETIILYPHNGTKFTDYIIDKFYPLYSTMLTMGDSFKHEAGVYDCTQYSKDFVLALREKGIESVVITGRKEGATTSHAWIGVMIEPQRGEFITTEDGYTPKGIRLINEDGTITNIKAK